MQANTVRSVVLKESAIFSLEAKHHPGTLLVGLFERW